MVCSVVGACRRAATPRHCALLCRRGASGHDGRRGERALRRAARPAGVARAARRTAPRTSLALPR